MSGREGFDSGPVIRQLLLTVAAEPGRFGDERRFPLAIWVAHPRPTRERMAEAAGVSLRTMGRWLAGGRVSPRDADRVATRLGLHAVQLWPEFGAAA